MTREERAQTVAWIASVQRRDGEIPWARDGKSDPWDHVHAAMGLTVGGYVREARAAFRFLAATQYPDGGFACERRAGKVVNSSRESNHAAYFATGLWHLYSSMPDPDFLAEMWPALARAIDFVVRLQEPGGEISWAVDPEGRIWRSPLLTGSSSMHGSLVCAIRIAERLGHNRPAWRRAHERLRQALRFDIERFAANDLPDPPGRHSMDWYYPVLGGALRGAVGRARLQDEEQVATFLEDGVGCRCVRDRPWYTVAETCELGLAFDAVGLADRARQIVSWVERLRDERGAYGTGVTHPDRIVWPYDEQTPWTAATVVLADDALLDDAPTSGFFRGLAGDDLDQAPRRAGDAAPARPGSPIDVAT